MIVREVDLFEEGGQMGEGSLERFSDFVYGVVIVCCIFAGSEDVDFYGFGVVGSLLLIWVHI